MVKCITFLELTKEFLRLSLDEREGNIREWIQLASKYGIRVLFYGVPLGVKEDAVFVLEYIGRNERFFNFMREWLELGTPDAVRFIKNTRTITVY
jgi:hypothetical protein